MIEFKIITGDPTKVQTILNQWRHNYNIVIQSMNVNSPDSNIEHREITILLTRETKEIN